MRKWRTRLHILKNMIFLTFFKETELYEVDYLAEYHLTLSSIKEVLL